MKIESLLYNGRMVSTQMWLETGNSGQIGEFPVIWLRDTSPDEKTYSIGSAMKARWVWQELSGNFLGTLWWTRLMWNNRLCLWSSRIMSFSWSGRAMSTVDFPPLGWGKGIQVQLKYKSGDGKFTYFLSKPGGSRKLKRNSENITITTF